MLAYDRHHGQAFHRSLVQDRAPLVPPAGKLDLPMPNCGTSTPWTSSDHDFNDLIGKQAEARAKKKEDCWASCLFVRFVFKICLAIGFSFACRKSRKPIWQRPTRGRAGVGAGAGLVARAVEGPSRRRPQIPKLQQQLDEDFNLDDAPVEMQEPEAASEEPVPTRGRKAGAKAKAKAKATAETKCKQNGKASKNLKNSEASEQTVKPDDEASKL